VVYGPLHWISELACWRRWKNRAVVDILKTSLRTVAFASEAVAGGVFFDMFAAAFQKAGSRYMLMCTCGCVAAGAALRLRGVNGWAFVRS
jgi:hypothetical protein